MKKILFLLLTTVLLLACSASASAEFALPKDLKTIEDEAFLNVGTVGKTLYIPRGVEKIGSKAFAGTGVETVILPASVKEIAKDAFDSGVTFYYLPGTYADKWCTDNDVPRCDIRIEPSKETVDVYYGETGLVETSNVYADEMTYRWEQSQDQENWTSMEGQTGRNLTLAHKGVVGVIYVRCVGSIDGVELKSEMITFFFYSEKNTFVKDNCYVRSGDAIHLEWESMGDSTEYTLSGRAQTGGDWVEIVKRKGDTAYTVYGLEKDTDYSFKIEALVNREGKEPLTIAADTIDFRTKSDSSTVAPTCTVKGTALYIEWMALDRAAYDVVAVADDGTRLTLAENLSSTKLSYYVAAPNTRYTVEVTSRIPESRMESDYVTITDKCDPVTTGGSDPTVENLQATPAGDTVRLSWNELRDTGYNVYMSWNGGEEARIASTEKTYCDVGGLTRGAAYSFRVEAAKGNWTSVRSGPVTYTPPAKTGAEYRALLVGEGNFKGDQALSSSPRDVDLVARTLSDATTPNGGKYAYLRRNDIGREELESSITEALGSADDGDVSLFFITTHGNSMSGGKYAGALSLVDSTGKEESIRLDELAAELSKIKGKVLVWIASCGSGAAIYEEGVPQNGDPDFAPDPVGAAALNAAAVEAFAACDSVVNLNDFLSDDFALSDAEAFETGEFREKEKFYVLTASRYLQTSEGSATGASIFVQFLCDGIGAENGFMRADANHDKSLTQHELFMYIKSRAENAPKPVDERAQVYPLNSDYVLFSN